MNQSTVSPKRWFTAAPLAAVLALATLAGIPQATVGAAPLGMAAESDAGVALSAVEADGAVADAEQAYGKLPMSFAANQGQAPDEVRYMAAGKGYGLALTATEAVLTLTPPAAASIPDEARGLDPAVAAGLSGTVVRMRLEGSNPHPTIEGVEKLPGVANYLTGDDPADWQTGVATFAKVAYRDVYPGIDLVWYGHEGRLEHDFVVGPGADPDVIEVAFDGAERLTFDGDALEIHLPGGGTLTERIPAIYQTVGGQRRRIEGSFQRLSDNRVGFDVGRYDHTKALVIDPVLVYSTYLGGSGSGGDLTAATDVAIDSAGALYVTGHTSSAGLSVSGDAIQSTIAGRFDAFVTKLDASGSLVYSSYLGGSSDDGGSGIAVDASGIYISGSTRSADFPVTPDAAQGAYGGAGDAFATKLDLTGTTLIYSTYLGGSFEDGDTDFGQDGGLGGFGLTVRIAVVAGGAAYLAGETDSADFPVTSGAAQGTFGGRTDAFVARLDATGSTITYATYIGGGETDEGEDIAVDQAGAVYITGVTASSNFPVTSGAAQETFGGGTVGDAFMVKLDPAGNGTADIDYATYLGGTGNDEGFGIDVEDGSVYVTGTTQAADFPVTDGVLQDTLAVGEFGGDAFVTKLNPGGNQVDDLAYSTYLGGTGDDQGLGVAVQDGYAYVTGASGSSDFPATAGVVQDTLAGGDAFVAKLEPDASSLGYATYLGGNDSDGGGALAVAADGVVSVVGSTFSADFPTASPVQPSLLGFSNAFVSRLNPSATGLIFSTYLGGESGNDVAHAIAVDQVGAAYIAGTTGSFDFPALQGSLAAGPSDAFVVKLDPAGTSLEYSTYIGGRGEDTGTGIAVDATGSAYVAGTTRSIDFPTADPIQATRRGPSDAFVLKLAGDGSLVYSTYLGGSGLDGAIRFGNPLNGFGGFTVRIAVDAGGAAVVAGETFSTDFPTTAGAPQESLGGELDAFVTKIDSAGTTLLYSTYLGGSGFDKAEGVTVGSDGAAYITGPTSSANFPITSGSFQSERNGDSDAFVTKVQADGTISYSTYLGGGTEEFGASIAIDSDGGAYVAGFTSSSDFPTTPGGLAAEIPGGGFVTKLNPAGDALVYSTRLQGSSGATAIAVDGLGSAVVVGTTTSEEFQTEHPFQATLGGATDAFVSRLSPLGTVFGYSSYLGGSADDFAHGVALNSSGAAYVVGATSSTDFPVPGDAIQPANADAFDAFVTKIAPLVGVSVQLTDDPDPVALDSELTYTATIVNWGPDTAPAATLAITLSAPGTAESPDCASVDSTVTCAIVGLAAGQQRSFAVTIVPTETGVISASAEITVEDFPSDNPNDNADSEATTVARFADLAVTKSDDEPVMVGEILTYTLTVTNQGPHDATGVTLSDFLPTEVSLLSGDATQGTCTDTVCDLGSLAPGATVTVVFATHADVSGTLTNFANVTANELDPNPDNNFASEPTMVAPGPDEAPDLPPGRTLVGTGPLTQIAGELHEGNDVDLYRVCVTGDDFSATTVGGAAFNTKLFLFDGAGRGIVANHHDPTIFEPGSTIIGPVYTNGDPLTFTPGPHLLAISSAGNEPLDDEAVFIFEGGLITDLEAPFPGAGPLAAWTNEGGTSGAYTITLTGATFVSQAPCAEAPPDEAPDLPPGQTLEGTGPLTQISGELGDNNDVDLYRICVTGDAFSATTLGGTNFDTQLFLFTDDGAGVAANDDPSLIAGPTYTNGDPLTFTPGPHLLGISSFNNDSLDAQASPIFPGSFGDLEAPIPGAGPLAAWSGEGGSSGPYTIALTGATFIGEAPCLEADLEVTKTGDEPVVVGETLTYTLTVTNHGPSDATDVVVVDALPAGVTLLSATPSQGTCQATACLLGTLADGATATVSIAVRADEAGPITNTATVAATEPDPVPENNTATETTVVQDIPPPVGTGRLTVSVVGGDPDFTLDGPFDADLTLDPGESRTFEDIPTGVYTLTMTGLEDGLVVDAISCGAATLSVDLVARRVVFEIGDDDTVTCRFTVSDDRDDDGGYDDDPGGPGFDFDTPFDDAGGPGQPNPSPTGDPTLAGVLAVTNTETSGGGPQDAAVQADVAGQPAIGPVAAGELPRTGNDLLPIGLAAAFLVTGRTLSALARRRRTRTA